MMAPAEPIREQQKLDLAVEVLRTSGQLRLAARGYSMLPSLWPGDVLTLQAAGIEQFAPQDLLLYCREGRFFIHRVLRRTETDGETRLITRGDSMPQNDLPVSSPEVLAKVMSVERHGQELPQVPRCTLLTRSIGLPLGSWGRLRSVVLQWRQGRSAPEIGVASDGTALL